MLRSAQATTQDLLEEILAERILSSTARWASMIYAHEPTEEDYRGTRFAQPPDPPQELHRGPGPHPAEDDRGHPPRLPGGRRRHHRDRHVQRQRRLAGRVRPRGARRRAEPGAPPRSPAAPPTTITRSDPDKPRFVAGSIGPTNKQLSMGIDVDDPGRRDVTFDEMVADLQRADPTAWSTAASTSCCPRRRSTRWS